MNIGIRSMPRKFSRQRGAVLILLAPMMIVLIGMTALSVDIGRVMVVRNELQNAADAAALAGAGQLGPNYVSPSWGAAAAAANTSVTRNSSENVALQVGSVQTGYWKVTEPAAAMESTGFDAAANPAYRPAVRVTVTRASGSNGGPMQMLLAPIVGFFNMPVSATAVAVISAPSTGGPGSFFPVALSKCLYDNYWNSATGQPVNDPSTGQPYIFKVTSAYHAGPCTGGQWTTFNETANDVPTVRNLIENGNETPLGIGDETYLQPGTKNTVYSDVPVNTEQLLLVVSEAAIAAADHGYTEVLAIAPVKIISSVGGSGKYIELQFIADYKAPNTSGGGSFFGATTPAALAR